MSLPRSALPPLYYAIFGIYEPILTTMGFIGALLDPVKARIDSLNDDATLRMILFSFLFFWVGSFVDTQYASSVASPHSATATVASRDDGHGRAAWTCLRPPWPRQHLPPSRSTQVSLESPRATGESRRGPAHATPYWRRTPSRAHVMGSR